MEKQSTNQSNGVQKFTNQVEKYKYFLAKKKPTWEEFHSFFPKHERQGIGDYIAKQLKELKGDELDDFIENVSNILPDDTKNQMWENNHAKITCAISFHIKQDGCMPTKNEIAKTSGLSRTTIYKHLKEYSSHPLYIEQSKEFKFMADQVLAKVFQYAMRGDTKAARLYLEATGVVSNNRQHKIKTQNNYIQINGVKLSQETVRQLPKDQLAAIENILLAATQSQNLEE